MLPGKKLIDPYFEKKRVKIRKGSFIIKGKLWFRLALKYL